MSYQLPDQVLQGLGLLSSLPSISPPTAPPPPLPPVDDALVGAPQATPDLTALTAPPTAPEQPVPEPPNRGDFVVPVSAFGQPGTLGQGGFQPPAPEPPPVVAPADQSPTPPTPTAPQPSRPMGPDDQVVRAQQKQSRADVATADAIAAKRDTDVARARDEMAAYKAYDAEGERIAQQQKAFAEEATKVRAQKQAYVESTLRDVESYRVDQNKYLNEMGLGNMAGWGVAMILSNIGDALQGKKGENAVLAMLQDQMHRAVVAQVDERDRLKERNAGARHELDRYDQFTKDRGAQIALMDAQNEKRFAQMIRAAGAKAAEPAAQAIALDSAAKLEQSSAEKAQKAAEWAAGHDLQRRQLGVSQGNLAVSRFNAKETQRHNLATEQNASAGRDLEAIRLEREGKVDEAKLLRERGFGGEAKLVEIDPKSVKPGDKTVVKDGKTYLATTGHITMRDGSPFIPKGSPEVIADAQKKYLAHMRLRGAINEMLRLGPEFLSATANSEKYQQLRQLFDSARLEVLQFKGMGAPQAQDMEYSAGFIGTPDPTRWKDGIAGLNQALKTLERDQSATFRGLGLDKDWHAPDEPRTTGTVSETQALLTKLKSNPDENPNRAREATYASAYKASKAPDVPGKIAEARAAADAAAIAARSGQVDPGQREAVAQLAKRAAAGDQEALTGLVFAMTTAPTNEIRTLAADAVRQLNAPATPPETTTSSGVNFDPNGYNPEALIRRFYLPAKPTSASGAAPSP